MPDRDPGSLRRIAADDAEDDAVGEEDPEQLLVDRPEFGAAHRRAVEPRQKQQDQDRREHQNDADQLRRDEPDVEGDRPQDRVVRQEVPLRHDVRRGLHRVGLDVVVRLAEEVGGEEHEGQVDDHEHPQPERVLDRVVRCEREGVLRPLDIDAEGIVGLFYVQRPKMHEHQSEDDERQQVVQREEPVQGGIVDREPAPQPGDDGLTDQRDRREQVGDHRRAPEAHLPPRQHVAHERGRHHRQQNEHADDPQQLPRRPVRAVVHPAEEVDVDDDEEHRSAVRVQVAQQPAVIDVAHDPLDALERVVNMRRVLHCQHDAGGDHDHQHDPGKRAEVPPVIQVLRCRVIDQLGLHHRKDRQTVVDPRDHRVLPCLGFHGCVPQPMLMVESSTNS